MAGLKYAVYIIYLFQIGLTVSAPRKKYHCPHKLRGYKCIGQNLKFLKHLSDRITNLEDILPPLDTNLHKNFEDLRFQISKVTKTLNNELAINFKSKNWYRGYLFNSALFNSVFI